jgi:hypothetical protein
MYLVHTLATSPQPSTFAGELKILEHSSLFEGALIVVA